MEAREPLKRIRTHSALLCAVATIALLAAAPAGHAAASVSLAQIPPRTYVVATYDGSRLRLYLDGALAAQGLVAGGIDQAVAPLELGSYIGRAIWSGAIDEVAVYNRALPPKTIASRARLGVDPHPPGPNAYRHAILATSGLVSYWRLDDRGAVAVDSRGRNDGVFTAGVTKGAAGLITAEADKSIILNGRLGSVKVPPSGSLDLRRAFTLEAWVTTDAVGNRHIISRNGSWFLKTDAYGRWTAGVYAKGAIISIASRVVAHGPKLSPRTGHPTSQAGNFSFNPLWILILALVVALAGALRRRGRGLER